MKSNFKHLGDFIQPSNEFNEGMTVKELLGINNNKYFQNSHTNTIGIDLQDYRIVRTGQFAYNRATTRNGDKISIALRQGDDCIVSPSYRIFQVLDENKLLSEYVMMWFRRPEFDRYARYKSHGSAHEFFEWEQMCEVEIPIPHIDKQKEIVKEYNTIVNRIVLNNQLIQKLEETAQAIYKQWFVDFEFPDENENPYKSNGGEMDFKDELQKEIPNDWELKKIGDVVDTLGGGTPSTDDKELWEGGNILWYSPTDVTKSNSIFTNNTEKKITKLGLQKSSAKTFPPYSLLMTSRATIGKLTINTKEATTNQGFITIIPTENISVFFLFDWVKTKLDDINSVASGSTFPEISKTDFRNFDFILPSEIVCKKYNKLIPSVFNKIRLKNEENEFLEIMRNLLLSKLATIEN